jgi:hypothetical protein
MTLGFGDQKPPFSLKSSYFQLIASNFWYIEPNSHFNQFLSYMAPMEALNLTDGA